MPATSGTPTSANSKNPNRPAPASAAASDTRMLTGDPVSTSSDPACALNASGISSFDGERPIRVAITTVIGSSAAIAPSDVLDSHGTSSILVPAPARRAACCHDYRGAATAHTRAG